jgi:hypothetical protein
MDRIRRRRWGCGCFTLLMLAFLAFWVSGAPFAFAYWLDSERRVSITMPSPDGSRIAQVEHIMDGGAPLTAVTIRRRWEPNVGIILCRVGEFYADTPLGIRWRDERHVEIHYRKDASTARILEQGCHSIVPIFITDATGSRR